MGWIIAAAIVAFLVLLLAGRVVVFFDYNEDLAIKVKYMCFTVFKIPKKSKNTKKGNKEKGKKEKAKKDKEKKKFDIKGLAFDDIILLLKQMLSGIGKPLKKLLKRIVFSHMSINIICGGDDAANTAIKFGAMNIAAGNVLGLLDSFFTLKPLDDMNITVDFQSEKSLYDIYFEVRMSLFAGVAGVFGLLFAFLKVFRTYKKMRSKVKTENN